MLRVLPGAFLSAEPLSRVSHSSAHWSGSSEKPGRGLERGCLPPGWDVGEGPGLRTLSGVLGTTREQETPLPPAGAPQQGLCHRVSPGPAHASHSPHRWGEAEWRHREQGCPRRTVHAEGGGLQREPGGGTGGEQGCGKEPTHTRMPGPWTLWLCVWRTWVRHCPDTGSPPGAPAGGAASREAPVWAGPGRPAGVRRVVGLCVAGAPWLGVLRLHVCRGALGKFVCRWLWS